MANTSMQKQAAELSRAIAAAHKALATMEAAPAPLLRAPRPPQHRPHLFAQPTLAKRRSDRLALALGRSGNLFGKYRPDQARDDHGRFADEGGDDGTLYDRTRKPKGGKPRAPKAPSKPVSGATVGAKLTRQFNRIYRASRAAQAVGNLAAARSSLQSVLDSVRTETNKMIDTLAKAPPAEAFAAVKAANARRATSRKAALENLRQEVFRRIQDAHRGLTAYYVRPW